MPTRSQANGRSKRNNIRGNGRRLAIHCREINVGEENNRPCLGSFMRAGLKAMFDERQLWMWAVSQRGSVDQAGQQQCGPKGEVFVGCLTSLGGQRVA